MAVISAESDIVTVSVSYRLGILGFAPVKNTFNGKDSYGNLGLMDQFAALQWIQKHIHAYGGDPNQVTISGMSAGAISVVNHYTWEDSMKMNKIKKGILISNALGLGADSVERSTKRFNAVSATVDCLTDAGNADVDCLRSLPASQLITLEYITPELLPEYALNFQISKLAMPWAPIMDGNIQNGQKQRFQVLKDLADQNLLPPTFFGFAESEYYGMMVYPEESTCNFYEKMVLELFGPKNSKQVINSLPCDPNDKRPGFEQSKIIYNFHIFACGARNAFKNNSNKSYMYYWKRPSEIKDEYRLPNYAGCDTNACHADQIVWFFGNEVLLKTYEDNFSPNKRSEKWPVNLYGEGTSDSIEDIDFQIGADFRKMCANFIIDNDPGRVIDHKSGDSIAIPELHIDDDGYGDQTLVIERDGQWASTTDVFSDICSIFDQFDNYGDH